ncbi:MAG: hypothetical protein JHC41_09030 [Nitrosopumilus sp.]|nr:hypothetical protein [Nitrosopumilus sp.]
MTAASKAVVFWFLKNYSLDKATNQTLYEFHHLVEGNLANKFRFKTQLKISKPS